MGKVGLTGGIGAGKSTVARIFSVIGIPIYDADFEAKDLMNTDTTLINSLQRRFGASIYENGKLQRKLLASLVFTDQNALESLNALVHPRVAKHAEDWHKDQNAAYTLKEAALLFESGSFEDLDFVVSVSAPVEVRLKRVMARDKSLEEEVLNRMNAQWPQDRKDSLADFVIQNSGEEQLIPQVLHIHKHLLAHFPK